MSVGDKLCLEMGGEDTGTRGTHSSWEICHKGKERSWGVAGRGSRLERRGFCQHTAVTWVGVAVVDGFFRLLLFSQ